VLLALVPHFDLGPFLWTRSRIEKSAAPAQIARHRQDVLSAASESEGVAGDHRRAARRVKIVVEGGVVADEDQLRCNEEEGDLEYRDHKVTVRNRHFWRRFRAGHLEISYLRHLGSPRVLCCQHFRQRENLARVCSECRERASKEF
jgi:hypothetical protein